MAASTASHRPIKGILKKGRANSEVLTAESSGTLGSSAGVGSGEELSKKSQKWDEMSILATYHPADKDYELMNINERNTPYHSVIGDTEDESIRNSEIPETMVPEFLAQRLAIAQGKESKLQVRCGKASKDKDLRRQFELKRKLHYNEGLNIKFARQLISRELLADIEWEAQDQEMQEEASEMKSTTTEAAQNGATAEDNEDYDIGQL